LAAGIALLEGCDPRALLRPLRGDHRHAVEMHVEQHRARAARLADILRECQGFAVVLKLPGGKAALTKCGFQPVGILADVFGVHRVIGQREHVEEFLDVPLHGFLE
jgi:hypothetical protein